MAKRMQAPKEFASEWLLNTAEGDVGSWSALDESGPDKLGVGIFFRHQPEDGSMRVVSIVPGSAAHKSGVIVTGDKLISVDEESVFGWNLKVLRGRLHGTPGSHVTLDMENTNGRKENRQRYRINLARGSPEFIAYSDLFGPANAAQLDALVLQKREEQKFNAMVEKQLKVEQARFAQSQERRRQAEGQEMAMRQQLEDAQRELFEEEQKLSEGAAEMTLLKALSSNTPNSLW
mmetsp:Transcript_31645/g.75213  ORF Transcript_31645/g.75213 Transcript_31645/m.75213 type:complete len:233 (-) Transcript_31645:64-762(-)